MKGWQISAEVEAFLDEVKREGIKWDPKNRERGYDWNCNMNCRNSDGLYCPAYLKGVCTGDFFEWPPTSKIIYGELKIYGTYELDDKEVEALLRSEK